MASVFELAAEELARRTGWGQLAARGTLRIALKAGGLKPESLKPFQLRAVLKQVMPRELELRGIDDPLPICAAMIEAVKNVDAGKISSDPDEVFRRLAGD